jgi:hypothetical protein
LGSSSHTSVTDDTDGETSGHTRQTDGETGTELDEVGEERRLLLQTVGDQDGHDETVDTDNTRHDNGDNVWVVLAHVARRFPSCDLDCGQRTLDDQVRAEDTHGRHTNTGLGSSVGGTETREDDGGCAAHRAKEGLISHQHVSLGVHIAMLVASRYDDGRRWLRR